MIHPATELRFINSEIGYGVVATEFIPKGTITWAADKLDQVFSIDRFLKLEAHYQQILRKYCYRTTNGDFVLYWDNERFVNHSFKANRITTAYYFSLAIRDIHPGEEITDDYGSLNIEHDFEPRNEGTGRNHIYADDILQYYPQWDESLLSAFQHVTQVNQPLVHLLSDNLWATCVRVAEGEEQMKSTRTLYFDPSQS